MTSSNPEGDAPERVSGARRLLPAASRLRFQLVVATLARLVLNTGHRLVYPFLPAISRGLGVPPETITGMLSLRSALAMGAPLFGGLPDRVGRRQSMLVGLGVFCTGCVIAWAAPSSITFFIFLVAVVAAKFIYDPSLQAYLGDRTPYARRGLVIAFAELGWSGAALLGFPLVAQLIAAGDWRAPFLPLAALAAAGGLAVWVIIPRDRPPAPSPLTAANGRGPAIWRSPRVLAALSLGLLMAAANEVLFVVLGAWLETDFGLTLVELGFSTAVIGIAELAGEGLVMTLADRLGKRRAISIGLAASAAAYAALPVLASSLTLALVMLFLVFIAFEFTVVASFPLMTELVPSARGRVMTANVAFHAAGRMLGALLGGLLFRYGFFWTGIASGLMNALALLLLLVFVHEEN